MTNKIFHIICFVLFIIGISTSGILIKYTLDLKENVSMTSFISSEEYI